MRRRLVLVPVAPVVGVGGPAVMELAQSVTEDFEFVLVGRLLAFDRFQALEHVVHVAQGFVEGDNNAVDDLNSLLKARRRGRSDLGGFGRRRLPDGLNWRDSAFRGWRRGWLGRRRSATTPAAAAAAAAATSRRA